MPRSPRLDAPGAAHHVMIRGIESRRIFLGDDDRRDFLARLDRLLPEAQWLCFAWALLPNHVHLVLKGTRGGLSRLMARINTGYARSFNQRHARTGYLFQNRFKSRLVRDDSDLMGLVLYVHRNPIAGGLANSIEALERDPWCGHGALVGIRTPRPFESVAAALTLFADDPTEARRHVRARMREPDASAPYGFPTNALDERADARLGVARRSGSGEGESADFNGRRIEVREGDDPSERMRELLAGASRWLGLPVADICSANRGRVFARARAVVAYLAVEELGLSGKETAATLGISASAVSHALRHGKAVAREERLRIVEAGSLLPD